MSQILNITSIDDIERIKHAISNNEDFVLGDIKPLTYKIVLDGGRFKNYDIHYLDATIARIIITHQTSYDKLLKEIEKKFNVKFSKEDRLLKFKIQPGSLEFISEIAGFVEVLKQMESQDIMYTFLGIAGLWFSHTAYAKKLEKDIKEFENTKEIKMKELEGEEKEKYAEIANKAIESMKDVLINKNMQDAINYPKKEALSLLEEDETLAIDNTKLKHADAESFTYVKPEIDDIEEEPEFNRYTIESYNFYKEGKLFKLLGVPHMANSEIISAQDRMKLITKAENKEDVNLKLKITKDGITKNIKSVYIIGVDF